MLEKFHESIDKRVFYIGGIVCLIFVLFTCAAPERAEAIFSWLLSAFCSDFGWFYILSVTFFIVFSLYVAFSKYGKVKLGKDEDKPEHSTFSWFFMLFAAGIDSIYGAGSGEGLHGCGRVRKHPHQILWRM